jgi:hypothetical protein
MRPHPPEPRALSSWGISRSGSPTSKPIGRPPARSVSLQIAKDFVKSLSLRRATRGPEQREGLPDCEDLWAILDLQRGRAQQLWGGVARTQSDFEGRCRAIDGSVRYVRNHGQRLLRRWIGHSTHTGNDGAAWEGEASAKGSRRGGTPQENGDLSDIAGGGAPAFRVWEYGP